MDFIYNQIAHADLFRLYKAAEHLCCLHEEITQTQVHILINDCAAFN